MDAQPSRTLYADVAARLGDLIRQGTFKVGDRIPSVRALSKQWQVSITTVLDAYRLLERTGDIQARPQSGYYVQPQARTQPSEPGLSQPSVGPSEVSVSELASMMLRDASNPRLLHLGVAVPNPDQVPLSALNRLFAQCARRQGNSLNNYHSMSGIDELRVQVARRALSAGCAIAPKQVLITSGCLEGVALSLRVLCRPGDTVAIESPMYYFILRIIETQGLKVVEIPSHPRDGVSLEHLEQAMESNPIKAFVSITCYSNPSGSCASEEAKRNLIDLLARHDIPLIEDDVNGDLSHNEQRPPTVKAFDRNDQVILISSFAKSLVPGLRVGYVVGGRYQKALEHLKIATTLGTATLPQTVLAEFISSGAYDRHLRRLRPIYARNTHAVAEAVVQHFPKGTRATRPGGGSVVWIEMPREVDSLKLYEQALAMGVSLMPGHLFSATQRYRNFIRLNAANWTPAAEPFLVRLGELASKQMRLAQEGS